MLGSPNDTGWIYCVNVVDSVLPLPELFLLQPDLGLGVVLGDDGACNLGKIIYVSLVFCSRISLSIIGEVSLFWR